MRYPHDQVFLDLALAAATPVLVSGDTDLLALKQEVWASSVFVDSCLGSLLINNTAF